MRTFTPRWQNLRGRSHGRLTRTVLVASCDSEGVSEAIDVAQAPVGVRSGRLPEWNRLGGRSLLALPVLAVTCAVQLDLMASTFPALYRTHLPAVYPLVAQLTGWSLLALSIAAGFERTRYAALSGAVSAPVTFIAIAAAWFIPPLNRHLLSPPDTDGAATIAWYTVAVSALAVAIVAIRDPWHRYTRRRHLQA